MPQTSLEKESLLTGFTGGRWLGGRTGVWLGFVCLFVRLWVLNQVAGSPEFVPDHGDMRFYHEWALRILRGQWTDHHAFYGMPGYAYLLAGLYRIVGVSSYVAVFAQSVADALTAWVVFLLGRDAFRSATDPERGVWVGTIASLGWIFTVPAQVFSTSLMPTAYPVLAYWFVVWWLVRPKVARGKSRPATPDGKDPDHTPGAQPETAASGGAAPPGERPSFGGFAGIGLLLGVTATLVANILFLLSLLVGAIFGPRWGWGTSPWPRTLGRRGTAVASLLAGCVVGTAPCWVHNYFVAHDPVFLSAHGGINFWIGNNPDANGYPRVPGNLHADQQGLLLDSIRAAEQSAGRPLGRAEVAAYWSGMTKRYIVTHPVAEAGLLALKLRNFWSDFEYDDLSSVPLYRENGWVFPGLRFGWIAALALPGMALALRDRSTHWWVGAAVLLHMVSVLTVFVTERYRLAAVPGMLLFAAYGLRVAWQQTRASRRWRPAGLYVGLLAAASTLVFWPQGDPVLRSLSDYNTACADLEAGRLEKAQGKLERVLALSPFNAEVNFALGNLWLARNNHEKAKAYYRRALELDPNNGALLNNLGVIAWKEGRAALAERFLVRSVAARPDNAKTYFLLAQVEAERGCWPEAGAAVEQALSLVPGQPTFLALQRQIAADGQVQARVSGKPASDRPVTEH